MLYYRLCANLEGLNIDGGFVEPHTCCCIVTTQAYSYTSHFVELRGNSFLPAILYCMINISLS